MLYITHLLYIRTFYGNILQYDLTFISSTEQISCTMVLNLSPTFFFLSECHFVCSLLCIANNCLIYSYMWTSADVESIYQIMLRFNQSCNCNAEMGHDYGYDIASKHVLMHMICKYFETLGHITQSDA